MKKTKYNRYDYNRIYYIFTLQIAFKILFLVIVIIFFIFFIKINLLNLLNTITSFSINLENINEKLIIIISKKIDLFKLNEE